MNTQSLKTKTLLTSVKFQSNNSHCSKFGKKSIYIICLVVFLSIPVYFSTLRGHIVSLIGLQLIHNNVTSFPEFRLDNSSGVYHLSHVCIEPHEKPIVRYDGRKGQYFNETQMLVVYRTADQMSVPKVVGSNASPWTLWGIRFVNRSLPESRRTNLQNTAFFVDPFAPGNLFHFFHNFFFSLFAAVYHSDRLHPGINNHVLYRSPENPVLHYDSRKTYEGFIRTLHADRVLDAFYNLPENTCFQHAVFAANRGSFGFGIVVDHILRYYNLTRNRGNESNEYFLTITKRRRRRMLNIEDLAAVAKDVGFKRIRILDFETLSLVEQLKTMTTTKVLVGIQGAGLQWAVFMPQGGIVVEIAWPQKHHPFFYKNIVLNSGLKWKGVIAQDVKVNWTSYAFTVRKGVPVPEAEKAKILATAPINLNDNLWKWADIMIKKEEIRHALATAYNETN